MENPLPVRDESMNGNASKRQKKDSIRSPPSSSSSSFREAVTDSSEIQQTMNFKAFTAATATMNNSKPSTKRICPYLGTINRHLLDFDFEKLCAICLSNQHVYACLVCGKFLQGRGKGTFCYTHALEEHHYVYINLKDCRVYCLPENYAVEDASLDDIRFYLNPRYTDEAVKELNRKVAYGKALDGADFLPGCIGLNNLKRTDYFNVIVQIICKITPLRNKLLLLDLSDNQNPDSVIQSLGELIRKMFNPKNFKGIVSPHEFLQAVGVASEKKFRIGVQKDPLALFSWLMNRLSLKLKEAKSEESVVSTCLKGDVSVRVSKIENKEESEGFSEKTHSFLYNCRVKVLSEGASINTILFLRFLTLTPPEAPIFKDSLDRNMIPQVPIFDLLRKFDGTTAQEIGNGTMKRYSLWKLPPFLVFHINRFSKNNFFVEKNPTIVTFPVKNLELRDFLHPEAQELNLITRYNLVANVCHQGQPHNGIYNVHVLHAPTDEWYEIEDLRVTPVLPQFVALSESYVQVYQRQDVKYDGSLDEALRANALKNLNAGDDLSFIDEDIFPL